MNGWRFGLTMRANVGDYAGVQFNNAVVGFYVSAANTVRLVANTTPNREELGTSVTATTGGTLAVEVQLDCDRPAASPDVTLEYFIGGSSVGTRLVRQTATAGAYTFDYPMFWPGGLGTGSKPVGPWGQWYRRDASTPITSGHSFTRWDNDAADVLSSWADDVFDENLEVTDPFCVRPPIGLNPARHACGAEFICRQVQETLNYYVDIGIFRRLRPADAWSLVLTEEEWTQTTIAGARYASPELHTAGQAQVHFSSLCSDDLGETLVSGLTRFPEQYYGPAYVSGDGTGTTGDNLPYTGLWPGERDRDRCGLAVVPQWRESLEQIYVVRGLPQSPKPKVIVADTLRTTGNHDNRQHPFIDRRPDGRFEVGAFVNGHFLSWTGTADAATWAANRDDTIGDEANLLGVNYHRGPGEYQAAVGYHFGDEEFRLFWRRGFDEAWQEPVDVASGATAAAPYVTQFPDGRWEVGWYLAGAWTRYRSDDLLTWSAV